MKDIELATVNLANTSITKMVCLVSTFLLLMFGRALADDGKFPLLQLFNDADCMPVAEFKLDKVAAYDPEGKVKKLLGKPNKIDLLEEEDDGGPYTLRRLHYKDIVIDIVRGKVDRLYTASTKSKTPAGIHPGLTIEEISTILGRKPQNLDRSFGIVACPKTRNGMSWDASLAMTLSLNEHNVLVSIEIIADRP